MKAKNMLPMILGLTIIGTTLAWSADDKPAPPFPVTEASFQGVTNIVFQLVTEMETNKSAGLETTRFKQFAVPDPTEVRRLISLIRLGVETGNTYEFRYQAKFESAARSIDLQLSSDYFVVADPPGPHGYKDHTYQMPKGFWVEFQKLARKHGWNIRAS